MRDADWAKGWGELVVAYPQREEASEHTAIRAGLYRKHLDDLAPQAWLFAVEGIVRTLRFFPTIAELRAAAELWRPETAGFLPPARRTEEEAEADRQAAKRGLELCRAAAGVDRDPVKPMPDAAAQAQPKDTEVEATEARLALLRAQAIAIQGEEVTA